MGGRWSAISRRAGLGAALIGVFGVGLAIATNNAAHDRRAQADAALKSQMEATLSASTRRLEMSGAAALMLLDADGAFDAAADAMRRRLGGDVWFALDGAASFEARGDGLRLRSAALTAADGAPPSPVSAVAFRERAARLAERVGAAQSETAGADALFLRAFSAGDGERFWMLWSDGGPRALAAWIRPRGSALDAAAASEAVSAIRLETPAAAPVSRGDSDSESAARGAAAPALWSAVAAAPIGDAAVSTSMRSAPLAWRLSDLTGALARHSPFFAFAGLIALALLTYGRAAERRAAEHEERSQRMLDGVAAKQRELEASEERFRHLAESTNVVPWTADIDQQRFTYIGPQIEGLTGYGPKAWRAAGFWAQHVHPEDRQRVLVDAVTKAQDGRYATVDYRIRAANGRILHIRNMLSVSRRRGEDGRISAIADGFMLDVTEIRRAAAALEVARRKAEDANRVKSEFLANMSHELRTPLNAVIGFSEIMKDELFGPLEPRYREYAESVHASGKHLLSLINDVLDLSKIEAGRIELIEEPVALNDLFAECQRLMQEQAAAAGLHLTIDIDAPAPVARLDERRMKQVLLNLLSNAIKFTPPGGRVTLGARRRPGEGAIMWVRDTGVGMTAEEIPRALSKFGQIDGDLARKHQGTGLGLPIAKSLVESHGGAFDVRSRPNEGLLAMISLPEARMAEPRPDEARLPDAVAGAEVGARRGARAEAPRGGRGQQGSRQAAGPERRPPHDAGAAP
ncbi:MAG: PAS domain-containing sensor histidine kinase [Pseudomonadota bacterium]